MTQWKGYQKLEDNKDIDLGEYTNIEGPEDWKNGIQKALDVICERLNAPKEVIRITEIMIDVVESNMNKFCSFSRIGIASAIVKMAYDRTGTDLSLRELEKNVTTTRNSIKSKYAILDKLLSPESKAN